MNKISREQAKEAGLKRYFDGSKCKHGHVDERLTAGGACVVCNRIRASNNYHRNKERVNAKRKEQYRANPEPYKQRAKAYRDANPESRRAYDVQYYEKHKERIKANSRRHRKQNAENRKAYNRQWNKDNPEKARRHQRRYEAARRNSDPVYALRERVNCSLRNALIKRGYDKRNRLEAFLGCSSEDFFRHIERQFLPGMSWDNRDKWHIDHIVPLATAQTEQDIEALFHHTNLRPLWAADNWRKSDSIEALI